MAENQLTGNSGINTDIEIKKLSELRVIDLQAELKRRNLDAGGNKSALMQRLNKAIEEEGGNLENVQISSDAPSKKGRRRENEKVFEILGKSDKSEPLKEEEVEESVDQDNNCVESQKTKEEEDYVYVTIESADNALDLDGETNQEIATEENNPFVLVNRESKEQNTSKITDFEMVDIQFCQSRLMQPDLNENFEYEKKPPVEHAEDGEKVLKKDEITEDTFPTKLYSSKEDRQNTSFVEEADDTFKTDAKGHTGGCSGRNLWVSGLSSTTRATDLKTIFSKYGKVVGAKVVTDARSPGARCYGYVTMSSSEDATECITHLHRTELHGKMISVEKAKNEPAGKKSSDKKESETKKEKSSSSERLHSTDMSEKSSPSRKEDGCKKGNNKPACMEKDKEDHRSDRSRTSKSGSRGTERTVVMDKSKGEPVISVKTSSDSRERSSKSQDRKSGSKEKREILSFEKIKEQRERERQRQREREIREMERQRERDRRVRDRFIVIREREERERLRRERVRLEFERGRLDRERMERERLERERMRIEEERRIEQERIQREREELRRQQERLRYEQDRRPGMRRPFDVDQRRDEPYWLDSKRMSLDEIYRNFGRPNRFHDFESRDREHYMDHMDRRDESRSRIGSRVMNYSDCPGRDQRDGWGDYDRRTDERAMPPPGRDGRGWGEHQRKMDSDRLRPGDRGIPGPSGQTHINRGGMHGNYLPKESIHNMSAIGIQGGSFGGQNRSNDPRFAQRY